MEVAGFSSAIVIESEPTFVCWVPFILRKRDSIIASVNKRTKRVSHNYGVQIPSTVQETFDLDESNSDTLWSDALNKDMEKLKVAFDIIPDGKYPLDHYTKSSGHLIFCVRMTRKRRP